MATQAKTDEKWLSWSELPWVSRSDAGSVVQLCERMFLATLEFLTVKEYLHEQLPEVATEFSVQWSAVLKRTPEWNVVEQCGRSAVREFPYRLMEEALDREAGTFRPLTERPDWSFVCIPLTGGRVLALAGRNLVSSALPSAVAVGRTLDLCLRMTEAHERYALRIERLRSTLQITTSFAQERKSGTLLETIAVEATKLLDCDRASIFLWDRENNQVVACPALGFEGESLRLPDKAGIVGDVILNREPLRVDDAYQDPRFNPDVDKKSGYTTRNLLCVPMWNAKGELIGAFEAINKNDGAFNDDDGDSLEQLGIHAATAIHNTQEWEQLTRSRNQLNEQIAGRVRIVGKSPAIEGLRSTIQRLAAIDLPVLILGESGTGKEVVAQSLHFQGPRSDHPFIAVNCAALAETLLESELFGHEKGAFTDARERRQGKFELADGGTLFLDEIADMSLGGQAKLLRVLEQKVITRVGGSKPIPTNVRIVAATNADLTERVRENKFREDLYYRLSVVTQILPSLRERPEDILVLAEFFLEQFCEQAGRPTLPLAAEAKRRLQAHSWPGNVRELRNLMERVAFLTQGDRVEVEDLAFILSPDRDDASEPSADLGLQEATRHFQQEYIRRSIKRVGGNMSEAAKLLGLHRSNLYRKMRQLQMEEAGSEDDGA